MKEKACHSSLNEKQSVSCRLSHWRATAVRRDDSLPLSILHPTLFFSSLPPSYSHLLFCVISPSICQISLTPPDFPRGFSLRMGDGGMTMMFWSFTHTAESINTLRGCWWWLRPFTLKINSAGSGSERKTERGQKQGFINLESCILTRRINIMCKNAVILVHHTELAGLEDTKKSFCKLNDFFFVFLTIDASFMDWKMAYNLAFNTSAKSIISYRTLLRHDSSWCSSAYVNLTKSHCLDRCLVIIQFVLSMKSAAPCQSLSLTSMPLQILGGTTAIRLCWMKFSFICLVS